MSIIAVPIHLTPVAPRVTVVARLALPIEFVPDEDFAVESAANEDDNYWSTESIVKRLRERFDALLAANAVR